VPLSVFIVIFAFIAGGWAVDLYLGRVTRPHEDIEVAIFRRDQAALHECLDGWLLQKVVGGKLSAWRRGEWLALPVHEIHCFKEASEPTRLEVLLNESDGAEWVYRRNEKVRRPLAKCHLVSKEGVRFLSPEIVLLYKSKSPRAKDEQDFAAVAGRLGAERKAWLKAALKAQDPGHGWLGKL
jgi:hypothetical protein